LNSLTDPKCALLLIVSVLIGPGNKIVAEITWSSLNISKLPKKNISHFVLEATSEFLRLGKDLFCLAKLLRLSLKTHCFNPFAMLLLKWL
jgi:hypothetical protein